MDAKTRNKALRTANKALAALETYTSDFSAWIGQVREIVTKAGFEIDLSEQAGSADQLAQDAERPV